MYVIRTNKLSFNGHLLVISIEIIVCHPYRQTVIYLKLTFESLVFSQNKLTVFNPFAHFGLCRMLLGTFFTSVHTKFILRNSLRFRVWGSIDVSIDFRHHYTWDSFKKLCILHILEVRQILLKCVNILTSDWRNEFTYRWFQIINIYLKFTLLEMHFTL